MIQVQAYKLIHIAGILALFVSLGGLSILSQVTAGERAESARKVLSFLHGIALALILVAGFGMLARMGIAGAWPAWIWVKIVIWLLLAATPPLLRRARGISGWMLLLLPLIGTVAGWLALYKPGS